MDTINIDNIQYSNHGCHFTGDFGYGILSSVISNLFLTKYIEMSNSFLLYKNNESFFQYITINNMFKTFIHIMKSFQHHLTITMEVKHHNSNYYNVGLYRCFFAIFLFAIDHR